jgi:hypothetical protein
MKRTANTNVQNTNSSASRTVDVFSEHGSVTETRTALMDLMKMKPFVVSSFRTRKKESQAIKYRISAKNLALIQRKR